MKIGVDMAMPLKTPLLGENFPPVRAVGAVKTHRNGGVLPLIVHHQQQIHALTPVGRILRGDERQIVNTRHKVSQ